MAETELAPNPVAASTSDDDELTHTACVCDPDTALCGADVSESDWCEGGEDDCIVCDYLDDYYYAIGTCCRLGAEWDCG